MGKRFERLAESDVRTEIYRIMPPPPVRSTLAIESHAGLRITDLPSVRPESPGIRAREKAASLAHAGIMEAFLSSEADFSVVLEDDALLGEDRGWMAFAEFDFFIPFSHNREHRRANLYSRRNVLPRYGSFAYLCSRKFARQFLPRLRAGEVIDHAMHRAAQGLRKGSFAGNLVNHDNQSVSLISEVRRRKFARHGNSVIWEMGRNPLREKPLRMPESGP